MNVLHVLNELRFSGAEMLLSSAAPYLIHEGSHHTILSTGQSVGEYANVLEESGFRIEHIPFGRSPLFLWELAKFIRRNNFDVVHIHAERGSFWTGVISILSAKRVIRTIHNTFNFGGVLRIRRAIQRRLLDALGVQFVACSRLVGRVENERFGIKPAVVSNWMNPDRVRISTVEGRRAARASIKVSENAFVVVSLANYGPAKNLEAVVEAVRLCANELDVVYLQCGAGGSGLSQAVSLGANEPVRLMGPIEDIASVVEAADAFVCTSFNEGGQISLLEVACAGLVCITTRVGLAEEFEGQPNVTFIEPTGESLARAISAVSRVELVERIDAGRQLRAYALARFSPEVGAMEYRALYGDTPSVDKSTAAKSHARI